MHYGLELAKQQHQELVERAARARLASAGRRRPVRSAVALALRRLADRVEQPLFSPTPAA